MTTPPFFRGHALTPPPPGIRKKGYKNIRKGYKMTQNAFMTETLKFISTASWLTDEDGPAVISLLAMAEELDQKINPPLVAQYGLTYRNLLKRKPQAQDEGDELAKLLKR